MNVITIDHSSTDDSDDTLSRIKAGDKLKMTIIVSVAKNDESQFEAEVDEINGLSFLRKSKAAPGKDPLEEAASSIKL